MVCVGVMRLICYYLFCFVGDLKRTPCKTSLQAEIEDEEADVQEIPAPQEHQGDRLTNDPTFEQNERGEGGYVQSLRVMLEATLHMLSLIFLH
jgi:hypothetical protein